MTVSQKAVSFIDEHADQPFFLYYPTTGIHVPHTPNARFKGASKCGAYGDSIVEFDWAVGEIVAALERHGIADNTLLIVTSDNGAKMTPDWRVNGHRPNGPWRGEKAGIYEAGHRIPFIARWPGRIAPGSSCDETICLVDLFATCAALVGADLPRDAGEDSYSLLPVLRGEQRQGPLREATVHHSVDGTFAIRQGRWKYIDAAHDGYHPVAWKKAFPLAADKPERDPATGEFKDLYYYFPPREVAAGQPPGQLYDLARDPGETTNLYTARPKVVARLQALLQKYKQQGRSRP